MVESVLAGYNGTIFAYGQTGSGKTYTMVGEFDDPTIKGIIPRAFDYIFERIKQIQREDPSSKYTINIAFIQIYLETIQDLFEPNNQVKIREDPDKGVFLENCLWIKVKNTYDCSEAFKKGEKNRITECTKMNAHSSRSHALLIARIERKFTDEESNEHIMTQGHLYLVDLAGSERVTKTNARELRLEEAKKINYSLLILGNCIQSLTSTNSKYVSYRDSKLTRILQESLGGNAKTSLIVTISPSGYNTEETLSALNFGLRAMKVQNKPIINRAQDYQAMCIKLQEEYDKLMEEYSKLSIEYDKVCEENEKLKSGETFLNLQSQNIKQQIKNSNNNSLSSKEFNKIKTKFENQISELENYYKEVIKNKEEENIKIMKDIDNALIKKDNEIQDLKNKLNENGLKMKNMTEINNDINKEIEDLQKTCNDMLIEKEQLISKINQLTLSNKNLSKNYDLLNKTIEDKKDSLKENETQTDPIINPKIKDLLFKHKISAEDINNDNFSQIITQLVIGIETMFNDGAIINAKLKKFNESIGIITKNYEEKLKKLIEENETLKKKIITLNNEKDEIIEEKRIIKIEKENELNEYKNKINTLIEEVEQINENNNNIDEIKKEYEKQIDIMKNDNKMMIMNNQTIDSELKILKNNFGINEKNLNKTMIQFNNENNLFNQFKKQIKKIDTLIDNDLVNINNNNYEYNLDKAKTEGSKFQSMIEEIDNNLTNKNSENFNNSISNKSFSSNNMSEIINKINEDIQENKNNSINFINMISKLYNKYIDLLKKYRIISKENEKNNSLKVQKYLKNDENLKNRIISVTNENIEKFSLMCDNTDDLKEELNNLCSKLNKIDSFDTLKIALDILAKLLLRAKSYRDEKELEIENLNGKIIYLLTELDIYKKNLNLNKENNKKNELQIINKQLRLKDEEIKRLNQDIDDYLKKIKELNREISLLKDNKKNNNKISKSNEITSNQKDNILTKEKEKDINYNNSNTKKIDINNNYQIKNLNIKEINSPKYNTDNNINNFNKNKIYKENNNDDSENSDDNYEQNNLSEEEQENNLIKIQDDIDKIKLKLKELNEKESQNESENNY